MNRKWDNQYNEKYEGEKTKIRDIVSDFSTKLCEGIYYEIVAISDKEYGEIVAFKRSEIFRIFHAIKA